LATLKNVQAGWKGLQDVINRIIDTVNSQTPLEGSGIRIVDTSNGKLISVASETTGGGGGGSGGGGGGSTQEPHLLINAEILHGMKWEDVTVVDPVTCAQSTITVLRLTRDLNDSITIDYSYYYWASPMPPGTPPFQP
jgi:hypothetical protein